MSLFSLAAGGLVVFHPLPGLLTLYLVVLSSQPLTPDLLVWLKREDR